MSNETPMDQPEIGARADTYTQVASNIPMENPSSKRLEPVSEAKRENHPSGAAESLSMLDLDRGFKLRPRHWPDRYRGFDSHELNRLGTSEFGHLETRPRFDGSRLYLASRNDSLVYNDTESVNGAYTTTSDDSTYSSTRADNYLSDSIHWEPSGPTQATMQRVLSLFDSQECQRLSSDLFKRANSIKQSQNLTEQENASISPSLRLDFEATEQAPVVVPGTTSTSGPDDIPSCSIFTGDNNLKIGEGSTPQQLAIGNYSESFLLGAQSTSTHPQVTHDVEASQANRLDDEQQPSGVFKLQDAADSNVSQLHSGAANTPEAPLLPLASPNIDRVHTAVRTTQKETSGLHHAANTQVDPKRKLILPLALLVDKSDSPTLPAPGSSGDSVSARNSTVQPVDLAANTDSDAQLFSETVNTQDTEFSSSCSSGTYDALEPTVEQEASEGHLLLDADGLHGLEANLVEDAKILTTHTTRVYSDTVPSLAPNASTDCMPDSENCEPAVATTSMASDFTLINSTHVQTPGGGAIKPKSRGNCSVNGEILVLQTQPGQIANDSRSSPQPQDSTDPPVYNKRKLSAAEHAFKSAQDFLETCIAPYPVAWWPFIAPSQREYIYKDVLPISSHSVTQIDIEAGLSAGSPQHVVENSEVSTLSNFFSKLDAEAALASQKAAVLEHGSKPPAQSEVQVSNTSASLSAGSPGRSTDGSVEAASEDSDQITAHGSSECATPSSIIKELASDHDHDPVNKSRDPRPATGTEESIHVLLCLDILKFRGFRSYRRRCILIHIPLEGDETDVALFAKIRAEYHKHSGSFRWKRWFSMHGLAAINVVEFRLLSNNPKGPDVTVVNTCSPAKRVTIPATKSHLYERVNREHPYNTEQMMRLFKEGKSSSFCESYKACFREIPKYRGDPLVYLESEDEEVIGYGLHLVEGIWVPKIFLFIILVLFVGAGIGAGVGVPTKNIEAGCAVGFGVITVLGVFLMVATMFGSRDKRAS